jgi:hypothetical protein
MHCNKADTGGAPMFKMKRKTVIVLASILASAAIVGIVGWIFFPAILRFISPTLYAQYALGRTGVTLRAELASIDEFFGLPDLSEPGTKRLAADLNGISAGLNLAGWDSPTVDLSKLNVGVELLHDREAMGASLDLRAGWDGVSFLLTLFADPEQIALALGDGASFVVGTETFGRELAALGLPVDEDLKLDLGFLFPETVSDESQDEALIAVVDFLRSLRFRRDRSADHFAGLDGTVMTAAIDGPAFEDFLHDLADRYLGRFDANAELSRMIREMGTVDHELSLLIGASHTVQAIRADIGAGANSSLCVMIKLTGAQHKLDRILIDVELSNDGGKRFYAIESGGRHVPADGRFTTATTIFGLDIGTIRLDADIRSNGSMSAQLQAGRFATDVTGRYYTTDDMVGVTISEADFVTPLGTVNLSGEMGFEYGNASSDVRDISLNAYSIADFNILELRSLYQIVRDILSQDQALMDMFGQRFYGFALRLLFGDQLGADIADILGDRVDGFINLIVDRLGDGLTMAGDWLSDGLATAADWFGDILALVDGRLGDAIDLLGSIFSDRLGGLLGAFSGGALRGQFDDLLSGIVGSDLYRTIFRFFGGESGTD